MKEIYTKGWRINPNTNKTSQILVKIVPFFKEIHETIHQHYFIMLHPLSQGTNVCKVEQSWVLELLYTNEGFDLNMECIYHHTTGSIFLSWLKHHIFK